MIETSSANAEGSKRATDRVFEWVLSRILTGEFVGGEPLRIRHLAAEVGTSVMPVREALHRLQEVGLATSAPHRGAVVKTFTGAELLHAYEVRVLLERQAAYSGTQNIDAEAIAEMRAAYSRMKLAVSAGNIAEALDEDEHIHRTAYRASGNEVLTDTIDALWLRCRPYKYVGATRDHERGVSRVWETQLGFIEAVTEGNAHTAAGIITDSLEQAQSRIAESFDVEHAARS